MKNLLTLLFAVVLTSACFGQGNGYYGHFSGNGGPSSTDPGSTGLTNITAQAVKSGVVLTNATATGLTASGTFSGSIAGVTNTQSTNLSTLTFNVESFGAVHNGVAFSNASITASSTTVSWTGINIVTSANIGQVFLIHGAGVGGRDLSSFITAIISTNSVTISNAASTTVSGYSGYYGSDDTAAIESAVSYVTNMTVNNSGLNLYCPPGIYIINGPALSGEGNSQIYIPKMSTNFGLFVPTLTIYGESTASLGYQYNHSYTGNAGTMFVSTLVNNSSVSNRVFDTHDWSGNPVRYSGQLQDIPLNNLNVAMHDMTWDIPRSNNTMTVDLGGAQGGGGGDYNLYFGAGWYPYQVTNNITFSNNIAFTTGQQSSAWPTYMHNIGICGYYTGIRNGDNDDFQDVNMWDCSNAFSSFDGQGHSSFAHAITIADCLNVEFFPGGTYANPLQIYGLTCETGQGSNPDTFFYPMKSLVTDLATGAGSGAGLIFFEQICGPVGGTNVFQSPVNPINVPHPSYWSIAAIPSLSYVANPYPAVCNGLTWLTPQADNDGLNVAAGSYPQIAISNTLAGGSLIQDFYNQGVGSTTQVRFWWGGTDWINFFMQYNELYFQVDGHNSLYLDGSGDGTFASNLSWGGTATGNISGATGYASGAAVGAASVATNLAGGGTNLTSIPLSALPQPANNGNIVSNNNGTLVLVASPSGGGGGGGSQTPWTNNQSAAGYALTGVASVTVSNGISTGLNINVPTGNQGVIQNMEGGSNTWNEVSSFSQWSLVDQGSASVAYYVSRGTEAVTFEGPVSIATTFPSSNPLQIVGTTNTYFYQSIINNSTGTNATADILYGGSQSTSNTFLFDVGRNGSGFNNPNNPPGGSNDGYLTTFGNSTNGSPSGGTNGGNIWILTQPTNSEVYIAATTTNNPITFSNNGTATVIGGNGGALTNLQPVPLFVGGLENLSLSATVRYYCPSGETSATGTTSETNVSAYLPGVHTISTLYIGGAYASLTSGDTISNWIMTNGVQSPIATVVGTTGQTNTVSTITMTNSFISIKADAVGSPANNYENWSIY